jgi:acetyl esterase/lipase
VTAWIYLGASAVELAFALNVLRPVYRSSSLSIVSFFAGWLAGELAPQVIVCDVIAAALFIVYGGLATWQAELATALTFVACLVLAVAIVRARGAKNVFDEALHTSFGDPDDAALVESSRAWVSPSREWHRIASPFPVRQRAVVRTHNVEFYRDGALSLRLDVHRPKNTALRGPTLIYVHGGGWVIGHRDRQGLPLMQHLASRGWVCFSVDYRLSPRGTFPEHLIDVKRAIAWVREHASEYGADTSFVALAGNSAGGHLAALAALTPNFPEYQPGFEKLDTSVDACLGFYGVYDLLDRHEHWPHGGMKRLLEKHVMKLARSTSREAYDAASPVARVNVDAPPFLIVHGECDSLVPVAEARRFAEALRKVSRAPVTYVEVPGAQHAFDIFPSVRTAHVLRGATRFLANVVTSDRARKSSASRTDKRAALG